MKNKKTELIEILEYIQDKVIVTGSYADGTQTDESDIDFYVKLKPEDEVDLEARYVEETYAQDIIRFFDKSGIKWGSVFVDSFHTDNTLIPLEFSAYYEIDEDNIFDIEIMGVTLKSSRSIYKK